MRFRRRSTVQDRKIAIDNAIRSIGAARSSETPPDATSSTDPAPAIDALQTATDASVAAGKARAALGGYVPIGHPDHPSRWSDDRRDALARADHDVAETTETLRQATLGSSDVSATDSRDRADSV